MKKILLPALFLIFSLAPISSAQEKSDPETWISEAETVLAKTDSYTAIFHKQERINGILTEKETIYLKFKKPFKVYMKWIADPFKGRELLYADGWNNNRLKIHEGGILGIFNMNLDPTGKLAMKNNRHPVTDTGLDNLVRLIGKDLHNGMKTGSAEFIDRGTETVYGRETRKFEGILPKDRTKGYYCYRALLNIDSEIKVPIRVLIYDWDNKLIEHYGYEDLKLNPGLTASDFDPKNPEYKF